MLILTHRCFIHGHAISRQKRRHNRDLLATVRPQIFAPHFFTIADASLLEKLNHKTKQENKVAATEQGNFYWERRLCLFWILYKESITMLLVSLVHQFVWPTFSLVFTRNGITSIFTISDRAAFRGTFRIEANQKSKVELYSCKSASWTSWRLQAVKHFHKVPSSMLDCVQSRHRQ